MNNTKQIEALYGKPIAEWALEDFNIIAQTRPDVADLLTVETCRENAAREDLPMEVKKIFVCYILIIAFKDANDSVEAKLQEWSKEYEKSETPVSDILGELLKLALNTEESDYARLRAFNTMLAYWSAQDDAKNRCNLHEYKESIQSLLGGVLEDLEFMGVRMFLLYTFQYIDLLYSTGSFYYSVYEEDILSIFTERLDKINAEYSAVMKEMEELISSDPELSKKLDELDPADFGMPDFNMEENNESKESTGAGETTESI